MTKAEIEIDRLRQENDRLHTQNMEMDQMIRMQKEMAPPLPNYGGLRDGLRDGGLRDRSRSPEPGYASRSVHVEVAELKDKLEQTQTELRRTQAELRLNQGDYERSHVELEQMQEKVHNNIELVVHKLRFESLFFLDDLSTYLPTYFRLTFLVNI